MFLCTSVQCALIFPFSSSVASRLQWDDLCTLNKKQVCTREHLSDFKIYLTFKRLFCLICRPAFCVLESTETSIPVSFTSTWKTAATMAFELYSYAASFYSQKVRKISFRFSHISWVCMNSRLAVNVVIWTSHSGGSFRLLTGIFPEC